VVAPGSHLYADPVVQARDLAAISIGSRLAVAGSWGAWASTPYGYVPLTHIRPVDQWAPDPVSVAESLLGTPYLWGGNSRFGIDCSGLVQMAMHACGRECPGDSDMQMQMGRGLTPGETLQRGDLIFWKGHVAMVVNPDVLIHANGSTMSVAYEGIRDAVSRISAGGGGLVQARQRV
jgi:cell wall-associated NlpC family hydrolase